MPSGHIAVSMRLLVVAWIALMARQHTSPSTEQMIAFCITAGWYSHLHHLSSILPSRRNGRRGAQELANALMRQTPSRLPDLMVNGNGVTCGINTLKTRIIV